MLEDENLEEYGELTEQEIEKLVAQRFGFKHVGEFRAAKRVTVNGCQELIRAMDEHIIAIYQA